jgi:hypothetical protein
MIVGLSVGVVLSHKRVKSYEAARRRALEDELEQDFLAIKAGMED